MKREIIFAKPERQIQQKPKFNSNNVKSTELPSVQNHLQNKIIKEAIDAADEVVVDCLEEPSIKGKLIGQDNFTILIDCGDVMYLLFKHVIKKICIPKRDASA